jgi:hypothetical protein
MKLLFNLLLLASTVYASNVKGKFSDSKLCGDQVFTVKCDFDADPSRRRNLRAPGRNNKVEDAFKKCTIDGLGAGLSKDLDTEPLEDCLVELNDDEHGDKTKLHIYMTMLTAQTDTQLPTILAKLEVLEKEDPDDLHKTLTSYSDFGLDWSC